MFIFFFDQATLLFVIDHFVQILTSVAGYKRSAKYQGSNLHGNAADPIHKETSSTLFASVRESDGHW